MTLTTQSPHAAPRTVQVSQSITQPGSLGAAGFGWRRKSFTMASSGRLRRP
jgi:hypothetical protein